VPYGDALAELDWSVGQVLARLKDMGLDERTLVVFTSDNGPWYGGSTGGLRGMKSTTWEGGFRVPCIVRWPGRLPAGRACDELAVMMDVFATTLAAAGVAPPGRVIDGHDLFAVLAGKAHSGHDVIFGHAGPRLATVRDARWKLHVLPSPDRRDSPPGVRWIDPRAPDGVTILAQFEQSQPAEYPGLRTGDETLALSLFDLDGDPGEQHNVAAKHPDIVARLKAKYDQAVAGMQGGTK
jgi:arylsulfatase A-like enzyme